MDIRYNAHNLEVLKKLERAQFVSKDSFLLQREAVNLSLRDDFERLLVLEALPELKLFPHQLKAVFQVLRMMRGRAVLADEVGLGKTIEAGVIAKEYWLRGLARRILILTPAALVTQWRQELASKLQMDFAIGTKHSDVWQKSNLLLASLDTAKRPEHAAQIHARDWDLVIVDEAHHLKNASTVNWQFVNKIRKKFLLLLTATPVQNDLRELYTLITLLKPGQLQTFTKFREEFMADKQVAKNLPKLRALLGEVMVRSTRRDTLLKFPARKVHTVKFTFDAVEQEFYQAVVSLARQIYDAMPKDKKNLLPLIVLLRETCSSVPAAIGTLQRMQKGLLQSKQLRDKISPEKVNQVILLGERIQEGTKLRILLRVLSRLETKVLVFTEFRPTQRMLGKALRERGIPCVEYHGALSSKEKDRVIEEFRSSARVLVSTEAGGEGRNLQFCHVMMNYDLPWNPMRVEQRIGRIHRLGQTNDVTVINLCSRNTIEEYVTDLLEKKLAMFRDVIGDIDAILYQADARGFDFVVGEAALRSRSDDELRRTLAVYGDELERAVAKYREVQRLNQELLDGS